MIPWVVQAKFIKNHCVWLSFNDGKEGIADLEAELDGPIFEPLTNPEYFRQFKLQGHTLAWDNGADFAPEFLYGLLTTKLETLAVTNQI